MLMRLLEFGPGRCNSMTSPKQLAVKYKSSTHVTDGTPVVVDGSAGIVEF